MPRFLLEKLSMKKRTVFYAVLLAICATFIACSKDFESNAPYKDVTIVYGILNSDDDTHYIKIYKGFLTTGDAYNVAQEYDSLYYFDKIKVEVEEYVNNRKMNTYTLDTTTSISREAGDFASPKQLLYTFTYPLRDDAMYLLRITNKETGRVVTAQTLLVSSFRINAPNVAQLNITNATPNPIKFSDAENAAAYDIYQYFYYIERDKTTLQETEKYVKRKINSSMLNTNSINYVPASIFTAISSNVKPNSNVERFLKSDSCIKFEVWGVNDELLKYVQVNTPSSSVVLDRLHYTNIKTDDNLTAGILGSRKKAESWYQINQISQDSLVYGSQTRNLGFHYFYQR